MTKFWARTLFLISIFVFAGVLRLFAQQDPGLEQDLTRAYVGQTIRTRQPYLNREVWYDRSGAITERPTPVCQSLFGVLEIKRVHVEGSRIDVEATRHGTRPAMRNGREMWPDYAAREIVLRFQSGGQPWTLSDFEQAFRNSVSPRGKFAKLPPGTTEPPPGSDSRIAYLLSDGTPVYRPGNGVTPPRMVPGQQSDPEYTDAARRARAGGTVILRFIVNEDGTTSNVMFAEPPLGFGLDEQSVRKVESWQFTPATLDGKPIKIDLHAETNFCTY